MSRTTRRYRVGAALALVLLIVWLAPVAFSHGHPAGRPDKCPLCHFLQHGSGDLPAGIIAFAGPDLSSPAPPLPDAHVHLDLSIRGPSPRAPPSLSC